MTDAQNAEEWKQVKIDVFPTEYEVSSLGRIRSLHKKSNGKIIKGGEGPGSDSTKIRTVWLANPDWDGGSIRPRVDALVARAFHGDMPDGHRLIHKNGLVWDDRAENLAYEDHSVTSSMLTRLTTVNTAETAKGLEKEAWAEVKKAQEALQMAIERAVLATRTWARLEAAQEAQKGTQGVG